MKEVDQMEKQKRGFALLNKKKLHEIAVKGGKSAVNRHKFTAANASKYGRMGGLATAEKARKREEAEFDESNHTDT